MSGVGWGAGPWGSTPWGGAVGPGLKLLAAVAARENLVQLEFSHGVYFSQLRDTKDASDPRHYLVVPILGSKGMDGSDARAVKVVGVSISADTPGELAQFLDLALDRSLTPYAAAYVVTVNGLWLADLSAEIDPGHKSYQFFGVHSNLVVPSIDLAVPTRDIANPQTLQGALDPLPNPNDPLNLGTIVVDDTGDYAFDEGVQSLKKRIYRRLCTVPGGFVHLGEGYGVGVTLEGKKLGLPSVRARLATQAEIQIAREPEVQACRVRVENDLRTPGLARFIILVKLRTGQSTKFSVPFRS